LFLWVEKRGMAPEYFARQIAQRLGVPPGAVGTAGLKDRHAVTRQWVSVPKEAEPNLPKLDGGGIRVLKTGRHTNKLKPGHLRGNTFRVLVRDADRVKEMSTAAIIDRVRSHGLPNFYGPQRFGREGSTVELGLQCLAGKGPRRIRPFLFRFALSAVQSLLFNDYLPRPLPGRPVPHRAGGRRDGEVADRRPVRGEGYRRRAGEVRRQGDRDRRADVREEDVPGGGRGGTARGGGAARPRARTGVVRRVREAG